MRNVPRAAEQCQTAPAGDPPSFPVFPTSDWCAAGDDVAALGAAYDAAWEHTYQEGRQLRLATDDSIQRRARRVALEAVVRAAGQMLDDLQIKPNAEALLRGGGE